MTVLNPNPVVTLTGPASGALYAINTPVTFTAKFTDAGGVDHQFAFTSGVEAEIAVDFPAPVTVDASTSNLTIDVNVGSWFTDASGAVIDPTNAANQEAIEQAIRASLSAFEDDNHDGNDDHEASGGH